MRTGVAAGPERILASDFLPFPPSLPFPWSPGPGALLALRAWSPGVFLTRLRFMTRCPFDQSREPAPGARVRSHLAWRTLWALGLAHPFPRRQSLDVFEVGQTLNYLS